MPERIAPTGDGRDDRDVLAEDAMSQVAHGARPLEDALLPPNRWLHSETVDELRAQRAQVGLASPQRAKRVSQPPLSRSAWLPDAFPIVGPDRFKSQEKVAPGRYVLAATFAVVGGLALGALAAVVAFAARVPLPGQ